jgi:hypothetical protein
MRQVGHILVVWRQPHRTTNPGELLLIEGDSGSPLNISQMKQRSPI